MLYGDQSGKIRENTERSLRLAAVLFPNETWVYKGPNIYIAKSRLIEEQREKEKWEREMSQVRILTKRGSVAVFLPEKKKNEETGKRCADMVLDGTVLEMKTVSGTRVTLGGEFRLAYKQGASLIKDHTDIQSHSVFIRLFSNLSLISVMSKIAGELKDRPAKGSFICNFETIDELHIWAYEELRGIIRKK
jgi:UPF0288 family protein (methanogenesis marker protein 3)